MTGGPAFPHGHFELGDRHLIASPGMSLRDYFAGQALAGLLANHAITEQYKDFDAALVTKTVASGAFDIADAMLKAREAKS